MGRGLGGRDESIEERRSGVPPTISMSKNSSYVNRRGRSPGLDPTRATLLLILTTGV